MLIVKDNKILIKEDNIEIDNISVIIDKCKYGGLLKYGDSKLYLDKYYKRITDTFKNANLPVDDILYIKFDEENSFLSKEEICTFVNYMIMCSNNGERIVRILNMDESNMKQSIQELKELGY